MAVPSLDTQLEGSSDRHPLLMDRSENSTGAPENDDRHEHVIDIARGGITSSSASRGDGHNDRTELQSENMPSSSTQAPASQSSGLSAAVSNSRNTGPTRRGDNYVRRHRSPLNSGLWICIELVVNLSQIIASIIVLSLSRHEKPQTPLFEWIIGYTAGCVATLPHLYWRYTHRNNYGNSQDSARPQPGSTAPIETTYTAITVTQAPSADDLHSAAAAPQSEENTRTTNPRLNSLVDHFKMALDCFFAVWFVVGNVWIFGGHSSATSAPNMYRLCIVFLTFSCIGYAMPFILCATICCCLPCIISVLGFREDLGQNRGATPEIINTLPTYKFKSKRTRNRDDSENNADGPGEGGILAAGTEKERTISGEDAVCCICLAKYVDNDELRELPCTHFFHMECVDKWLKINALCPLCKSDIGEASGETSGTGRG